MKKQRQMCSYHFRTSRQFKNRLTEVAATCGRSVQTQIQFSLLVILPLSQSERRYRFVPRELDLTENEEVKTLIPCEQREYIKEAAMESGLSASEFARQQIQVVLEAYQDLGPKSFVWTAKEFRRRIKENFERRWSQIN